MQRIVGPDIASANSARGSGRPVSPSPAYAEIGEHFLGVGPHTYSTGQLHTRSRDRSTSATSVQACNPVRKAFTHDDLSGYRATFATRVPVGMAFEKHRLSVAQEPRNASPIRLRAWQPQGPRLRRSYSTFACTETGLTQAQLAHCLNRYAVSPAAASRIVSEHSRQSFSVTASPGVAEARNDLAIPSSWGPQERTLSKAPDLAMELWTEPTTASQGSQAPLLPKEVINIGAGGESAAPVLAKEVINIEAGGESAAPAVADISIDGTADGGAGDESVEYSEPRADLDGLVEYFEGMTSLGKRFTEATYVVNSWTFGGVIPLWHHGFVLQAEDHGFLTLDFSRRGILWDTFDTFPDLPDSTVFVKKYDVDVSPRRIRTYCEETKPFSWHSNDCRRWARGVMQVMNITEDPLKDRGCYQLPPTPPRWSPVMPLTSPWPGTDCLACRVTSNSEGRHFPDCLR